MDGVVLDGTLVVMELEPVEPMLYFGWNAEAPGRLAEGLLAAIGRH